MNVADLHVSHTRCTISLMSHETDVAKKAIQTQCCKLSKSNNHTLSSTDEPVSIANSCNFGQIHPETHREWQRGIAVVMQPPVRILATPKNAWNSTRCTTAEAALHCSEGSRMKLHEATQQIKPTGSHTWKHHRVCS